MKKTLINILTKIIIIILFFVNSIGLANDRFTTNDVINEYQNYLRSHFPFSVEFEEKINYGDKVIRKEGVIKCDGNNFIVRSKSFGDTEPEERRKEFSYYNKRLLYVFNSLKNEELSLVSWLKPMSEDIDFKQYHLYPGIFGYLPFDQLGNEDYIPSVLQKYFNSISIRQEMTTSQITLTLTHEDILFEMVFDNKENFVPQKFKLSRKSNADQLSPGQIFSYESKFENYKNRFPAKYSYSIVYANSDLIDGVEKRTMDTYSGVVTFNRIKINTILSESDLKITEQIPNYTEVFMQDAPQIRDVWLDGEIVPYTDEVALARIRGHDFIPGVREPRFWLIAAGVILVILGLFFKIKMILQDWRRK
jgi:hypothetical protein